uniref:Uncharacterized protein n=1 Tax=Setaria digitata TaxID=48799 RepID=A0A915PLJ5_9BILA
MTEYGTATADKQEISSHVVKLHIRLADKDDPVNDTRKVKNTNEGRCQKVTNCIPINEQQQDYNDNKRKITTICVAPLAEGTATDSIDTGLPVKYYQLDN